jgi:hypothetical protein
MQEVGVQMARTPRPAQIAHVESRKGLTMPTSDEIYAELRRLKREIEVEKPAITSVKVGSLERFQRALEERNPLVKHARLPDPLTNFWAGVPVIETDLLPPHLVAMMQGDDVVGFINLDRED